jgi:hypothetical protein
MNSHSPIHPKTDSAPDFTAVDSKGDSIHLSEYRNGAAADALTVSRHAVPAAAVTKPYGCSIKY